MMAGGALVVSIGVHLAGFTMLASPNTAIEIAGGAPSKITMLGNSFADMTQGITSPVIPAKTAEHPEDRTPAHTPQPVIHQPIVPDRAAISVSKNENNPVVPVAAITPNRPTPIAPIVPEEVLIFEPSVEVQLPNSQTKRPVMRPAEPTTPRRKPVVIAPPKRQGGTQTTRKGQVDGSVAGQVASSGQGLAKPSEAGNAAASNYPGLVMRKISRIRKQRAGARGKATVGFKISSNGAATSVRIIRSSGSAKVDGVALRHIQRASPFPRPPKGARRSFSVEFVSKG